MNTMTQRCATCGAEWWDTHVCDKKSLAVSTSGRATMAVPTLEGMVDAIEALKASCDAGKWTLLAPDGRVWMNADPMILFAALAQVMQGRELRFGEH